MGSSKTEHLEVETKFDVEPAFALPPLTEVAGISSATGATTEHLDAVYFDTEDLRLIRNGVTLRRREGGHDAGWHLKLPAGGPGRTEIGRPLATSDASSVPDELANIVAATTRGRPLGPVARIQTTRRAVRVRGRDGREIAEIADDTVHAQTLGRSTSVSQWREIEIEALDGRPDGHGHAGDRRGVLAAAGTALLEAGARPAAGPAKLARALGPAAFTPELPVGDPPQRASAGRVVTAYLAAHTAALLAADARVRLDEPEAVHDLRVAARRLRSTLRTFRRLFDGERPSQLEERLRELNLLLNAARDGEVQLERFSGRLDDLDEADVLGPVAARVQGHLRSQHLRGREDALTWMRGEDYLGFLDELIAFVADPPYSARGRRPARAALLGPVRSTDRKLRRRARAGLDAPAGTERDLGLHGARKAAKRLRYAAEALTPVYGSAAAKHADRAKKVQNALGEHQDCVVAQDSLRDFAIHANLAGESSFTYGLLLGVEREQARATQDAFARRWPKLSRKRDRRWLR